MLDMEALAVQHAARVDPGLPLALPRPVPGLTDAFRASVERSDGRHAVRMYDVLPGHRRSDPRDLVRRRARRLGRDDGPSRSGAAWLLPPRRAAHVALGHPARRAHPGADRRRSTDPAQRALVEAVFERFASTVAPVWPSLRAQVVHTDLTTDNALVDDDGRSPASSTSGT